jgi:hypothetical protein
MNSALEPKDFLLEASKINLDNSKKEEIMKLRSMSSPGVELNNPHFAKAVDDLLKKHKIDEIIESGTHNGDGSTKVFAETGLPVKSIEVQYAHYIKAKDYLKDFDNVEIYHASSLPYEKMIEFIKSPESQKFLKAAFRKEIPLGCEGGDPRFYGEGDPVKFYTDEVVGFASESSRTKEEDVLPGFINNTKNQIIYLDSAGGVGWLEYQEVINLPEEYLKHKILLFDDMYHVKHYNTVKDLEARNFPVSMVKDYRSAYCDFVEYYE